MPIATRRTFLRTTMFAAVATHMRGARWSPLQADQRKALPAGAFPQATDPEWRSLGQRALDAATAAGARYAEVRFTVTRRRTFDEHDASDREALAVGVRALATGPWGFASHTELTPERMAQLGREAAAQARDATWPGIPPIELLDAPSTAAGHWATPVQRDPFTCPLTELPNLLRDLHAVLEHRLKGFSDVAAVQLLAGVTFERQERVFLSTAGAYTTQTISTVVRDVPHEATPPSHIVLGLNMAVATPTPHPAYVRYALPWVTPQGGGMEALDNAHVLEHADALVETVRDLAMARIYRRPGVYDVVFDGAAMAAIVHATFGAGLQYDRAAGYDEVGSSDLGPPETVLGTPHAARAVTILGDRTLPGGAATVGWDDEGTPAQAFPLVQDGVVVDYASSREFVAELAPWYRRQGRPVRSNGCVATDSAASAPSIATPNLVLQPARDEMSLDTLVAGVDEGLLICGGRVTMSGRHGSGQGRGVAMYTIKHGKRTGLITDAVYCFRGQDFWSHVQAVGGASTALTRGFTSLKGTPATETLHSVRAVAARVARVQVLPAVLA